MKSKLLNILVVFGLLMPGLIMPGTALADTGVFINEIHYDNSGTDEGEAIEIAGPSGTDLTGWSIVLYNGSGGAVYDTDALSGVIPDQQGGYGTVVLTYPSNGIQNGSPDGIALVDASNTLVQFLSYEGTFVGVGGPADGVTSTDIGVSEGSGTPIGYSLQLIGSGTTYDDFSWSSEAANTFGAPNTDQTFGGAPTAKELVINEIDYDQPGTDAAEFVEIRNNDSVSVDLSAYSLQFVNGNGGAVYDTINLPAVSLAAGDYFVVCANAATVANCDLDDSPDTNFIQNGAPDAVALYFGSTLIDTVSYEGDTVAPYTEGSGAGLVDDGASATEGISRCANGSDTDQNNVDFSLREITPGTANACSIPVSEVFINELRISGSPDAEYFELQGDPGTSLDGLTYVVLSGEFSPGQIDEAVDLTGYSIPVDGFFVTANSTAASSFGITPDLSDSLSFFGSPTTHMVVSGFTGSVGNDLDTNNDGNLDSTPWGAVVDSVSLIDGDGTTDYSYSNTVVGPDGSFTPAGTYRCDDAPTGSFDNNQLSFSPVTGTPGESNASLCVLPVTKIHDVQGSGSASPLAGKTVAIEGIVVGDFQDAVGANGDLNGFFVQEEDADADGESATSEGIFVFQGSNPAVDIAIGDHVRVEGPVSEFNGLTEITSFSGVSVISSGNLLPTVSFLSLPVASVDDFEAYEGMYVAFPQALTISEYFNFDRFGEIVLTVDRQFQPTSIYEPGSPEAAQLAQDNQLSRITLDDGRGNQNPDPAIHPNGLEFDLTNLFRGGDTVSGVTGVMDYSFGLYRIQPTQGASYTNANPRTAPPDDVGGNLTVASFNVLNYFTTLDTNPGSNNGPYICGPNLDLECRGANDANEFTRQRDKIIAAISAIDADVVGLIEIENHPGDVPTADLVSGLNDVMGAGTYDYIATGAIGTDAIRQAFIYKPATVSLVGDYAVLDDQSFTNPLGYVDENGNLEEKSRPALAQTFMDNETGGVFTAVVNHLKSKGSSCGSGDDDPEQGSCNITRTLGAQALVDWLVTDPTGSGDPDFLIIGDLNAYDKEDPIDVLIAGGYTDLVYQYLGEYAYSYVFDGQLGYLDHGLTNQALVEEVSGTTIWHINADEPDLIDYDTTFKGPNQDAIYAPDAYRSSDHDPVIVGLEMTTEAEIRELINDVQKLLDDGVLNDGQANALTSKLENVLDKLANGNSNAAANQLGAFINQVEDFVIEGILTTDQGDLLIKAATLLVEVLSD